MSLLYDMKVQVETKIKNDGLDAVKLRGQFGLRTGRLLALINPSTPDDPAAVVKFRQAAKELLNLSV